MNMNNYGLLCGRRTELFSHPSKAEWGYEKEQWDTVAIQYPKDFKEGVKYPLYVVFHSAGHDVYSTIGCVWGEGNHDIYHVPDDMFGLFLDCRVHADDWWWGGINALGEGDPSRAGTAKQPVENRCIATVEWMIESYPIDTDRVYAVGNSMGGSGALGVAMCRGDIFAAIKANVPAGVRHAADRCCLDSEAPEGFKIPEPPVVLDYSSQIDDWSRGHEVIYRGMREKKYAFHGFWGEFGHANNNSEIAKYNDLIHSLPVMDIKKSEPYPVFVNASTDGVNPWETPDTPDKSGQVNGFFRWESICDSADKLEMKLWLTSPDEWETRVELPTESEAELLVRRVSGFKLGGGESFRWSLGEQSGESVADADGRPAIDKITVTREPQVLVITRA